MLNRAALTPILIFTALELFGVGIVGAWFSVRLHFAFWLLTPVSFAIYGAAGLYARRAGATAWLAGAIVAVLEAVTWAILGGFGPRPTLPNASAVEKVFVVLIAIPIGAAAGAIGGRVGARRGTAGGVAA